MMPALSALILSAVAPIQVDAPNEILQQIDVPSPSIRAAGAPIEIQLDLDGAPSRLILEPFSVRSPEFRVLVKAPDGAVLEMPAPAATTWRGHIEGRPDSFVTASITDRGLQAVATDPILDLNWEIEPAG